MSGAQWSPGRLRELADIIETTGIPPGHKGRTQNVAALRAFARVVSAYDDAMAMVSEKQAEIRRLWTALEAIAAGKHMLPAEVIAADALDAGRGGE